MKFVENFYLPDAQALQFGLDSIFAFDHFDGSNDPTVTSTTDEFIKTGYWIERFCGTGLLLISQQLM